MNTYNPRYGRALSPVRVSVGEDAFNTLTTNEHYFLLIDGLGDGFNFDKATPGPTRLGMIQFCKKEERRKAQRTYLCTTAFMGWREVSEAPSLLFFVLSRRLITGFKLNFT
jgi:hypothetical protein